MVSSYITFFLYSLAVLGIGLWATRMPQNTAEEIHLGNREYGTWTSALSTSASTESGWVLLGMVGMGYTVFFWRVSRRLSSHTLS